MSSYKVQFADLIQINSKAIRSKTSKKQNKLIKQKEKSQGSNVNINFYMSGGRELLYSLNTNATPYNNFVMPLWNTNNPNIQDIQSILTNERNRYINELENQLRNPYNDIDRNALSSIQQNTNLIIDSLPNIIQQNDNIERLAKINALKQFRSYMNATKRGRPPMNESKAYQEDIFELGSSLLGDTRYVQTVIGESDSKRPFEAMQSRIKPESESSEYFSDDMRSDSSDFDEAMARALSITPATPPRDLEGMQKLTLDD